MVIANQLYTPGMTSHYKRFRLGILYELLRLFPFGTKSKNVQVRNHTQQETYFPTSCSSAEFIHLGSVLQPTTTTCSLYRLSPKVHVTETFVNFWG